MIRIFSSQEAYVEFMGRLAFGSGEFLCTSYLPSALFPRHALDEYFARVDRLTKPATVVEGIWDYGRRVKRGILEGRVTLCVEVQCLRTLCADGTVHKATPSFTVTYAIRATVLNVLRQLNAKGRVFVIPGPLPFVFRLHPPSGILVDVERNVSAQNVQGLWLDDPAAYSIFASEAARLIATAGERGTGGGLERDLAAAVDHLERGEHHEWPWQ